MFSDPFTAFMALVVLHFVGVLILFLFILRSLDATRRAVHETRANLQLRITDMEHQLNDLSVALREIASGNLSAAPESTAKASVELGELLEKGLPRLHAHAGTDLPDLSLAGASARKIPDSVKAAPGSLDISL